MNHSNPMHDIETLSHPIFRCKSLESLRNIE